MGAVILSERRICVAFLRSTTTSYFEAIDNRGNHSMTAEVAKYTMEQIEALELAPGTEHEKLEGWVPELASEDDLREALEKAFDYRGDVTITTQIRRAHRSLYLQPPHGPHAGRLICSVLHAEQHRASCSCLRGHRAPGIQRQGSRRRQALGRLGESLQREQSGRRKEHRAPSRETGLTEETNPGGFEQGFGVRQKNDLQTIFSANE